MKSSALVGGLTLASRILGFIRDMVIASQFGANQATDAFFVAFRIPNFLRRLFAEGAFSQALVPMLADLDESGESARFRAFADRMAGSFALLASLLTAIGMVTAPLWIAAFAPGLWRHPEQFDLSVEMLRVLFPYLFFISLTAFSGGLLNSRNHFLTPAFTPVLLNLAMITAAVWLAPQLEVPIMALAWGVVAGGAIQLAFQVPVLIHLGLLPRLRPDLSDPGVRKLLRTLLPALFGVSVGQINLLIATLLASFLASGQISWLYYSDRLLEFPLGLVGVGFATVILPWLARQHREQAADRFAASLGWAMRWMALIGFPATLGLALLSEPLMFTLFQHDQFTDHDALMAARSLTAYALGLPGFLAVKVLISGFSARKDLITPARCGLYTLAINLTLALLLAFVLAPPGWEHAGLALAVSLAALYNAWMLFTRLDPAGNRPTLAGTAPFYGRLLIANGALGALLSLPAAREGVVGWTFSERILSLGVWIFLGIVVYFSTLALTGLRPRHLLPPRTP